AARRCSAAHRHDLSAAREPEDPEGDDPAPDTPTGAAPPHPPGCGDELTLLARSPPAPATSLPGQVVISCCQTRPPSSSLPRFALHTAGLLSRKVCWRASGAVGWSIPPPWSSALL